MAEVFNRSVIDRWRHQPLDFIAQVLRNPETGQPFELFPAQREFLTHAFTLTEDGRFAYPEQCFGGIKKTGKSATAAMHLLTTTCLYGGRFAEAYVVANDFDQAQGRVFQAVRRIVEASPLLKREASITAARIEFPATGATIQAIASDFAGAAGGHPTISSFDEAWGYQSERARRMWDELVPVPTQKVSCRLVTSHAGFTGESVLLEDICKRGMALPEVGPSLRAGDGMLFAWHTKPVAPWQTPEWVEEMRRTMRPSAFTRQMLNEPVSSESTFVDMSAWDACVQPALTPVRHDKQLFVWAGVDASVKRDATALVACTYDKKAKCVRLVRHKVFTPTPGDPINFEATVEATLLDWKKRYRLRKVYFDPFQMVAVAQRLEKQHIKIEPFAQTTANLTEATSNLFDLIQSRSIVLYPDAAMRLAASRAVIRENSRGGCLDKLKQSHKIDSIVALAMAALAAVKGQSESSYNFWAPLGLDTDGVTPLEDPGDYEQPKTDHIDLGIPMIDH